MKMARKMTLQEAKDIALRTGKEAVWQEYSSPDDHFRIKNNAGWIEVWSWNARDPGWQACSREKTPDDGWTHDQPCECEFCRP